MNLKGEKMPDAKMEDLNSELLKIPEAGSFYLLLRSFLQYLLVEKNYSAHTLLAYRGDLEEFFCFVAEFNGRTVASLEPEAVDTIVMRRFLGHLKERGQSRNSVARKLAAVRSFYKYLDKEDIVEENPAKLISTPKKEKHLPRFLYYPEIEALLSAPDTAELAGKRDKALLEVLYASGLRVSELVSINHGSIDFAVGYVRVHGKGNKERLVPLGEPALLAVKDYMKAKGNQSEKTEPLFLNKNGSRLTDRSVRNILNKYVELASIKQHFSPHSIRHSFATHLLDAGADLRSVQEFLGHASLSATQVYTHVTKGRMKSVYDKTHPRA